MSAERISLEDFASAFSWEVMLDLPDDRAACEFVCGMLSAINASAEAGRPEDVAAGMRTVEDKLKLERHA